MAEFTLTARLRTKKGKEYAKKLRQKGWIPAIMYGKGEENVMLEINVHEFDTFFRRSHGENVIIRLKIEGDGEKNVIVKEIQRDPVRGRLQHVDFQVLHAGEKIMAEVPIILVGEPVGVKKGGVLEQNIKEIEVKALPDKLPPHIEVNVENLDIGDVIKVKDLKLEGVEFLADPEEIICGVHGTAAEEETSEESEGETEQSS